ncbi:MAG: hypothetical protein ACC612_11340 [Methanomethylovorans sp.]|uniref:hypothetical protein n=1 Tax=Methanomethylovorans sp. TaxID=2758717 RepID=UPI003530A624
MSLRRKEPETRAELDKAILGLFEKQELLTRSMCESAKQIRIAEKELSVLQSERERLEKCHFPGCHPDIIDAIQELDLKTIVLNANIESYSKKAKDDSLELAATKQLLSDYGEKRSLLLRPWEVPRPKYGRSLSAWGAV